MKKKVLITAALPYVNYVQHFGHIVGCHLPADIFYRFNVGIGNDAVFVGGSDDHGTATLISAKEAGLPAGEFVEKMDKVSRKIYQRLGISYSLNSGTYTKTHYEITKDFFEALDKNGFIEEKDGVQLFCENDKIALADRFVVGTCPYCGYTEAYGDQCDSCGKTYDSAELIDPRCKFCGEKAVRKNTQHLYLSLDKLSKPLSEWIESKKNVWRPHVYGEAKKWITEGLNPRAITRDISWGVPVPRKGYEDKVFYVWFDAPIGYISITKEWGKDQAVKDFWQNPDAEIYNFIGKDNISFHTVFFPAMLIGSGKYQLPENVVGLNFMNFEGQKFSKSKKIGVFCDALLSDGFDVDTDVIRAYLVTVLPETKDSDFKWEGFKNNTNSELVGKFGNFFNRLISMTNKYFDGCIQFGEGETEKNELDSEVEKSLYEMPQKIRKLYQAAEFREAYKEIMNYAAVGNAYIEKSAPWTLMKEGKEEECKKVLHLALSVARSLCIISSPILFCGVENIWQSQLLLSGSPAAEGMWDTASEKFPAGHKIGKALPLYDRIDDERLAEIKEKFSKILTLEEILERY